MSEPSLGPINAPSPQPAIDHAPELHPINAQEVDQAQEGQDKSAAMSLSADRFRTMFDAMLEGVQILDHNWRYLYLNATAAQHNRRANQELLGQVYMDMWPGIEATAVFNTLKQCLEEHTPAHMENEFVYPDGQIGWFELRIQPIPEGIFILSFDITDRKRAEIALRTSQSTYQNLFDNNPHPMWVYDVETLAFLMVNDAAIAHYGYTRNEFLGMTIKDIRPPEDLPTLFANLAQPPVPLEKSSNWRHCKKDGTVIDVEITSHTIQLGTRAARLVTVLDVTERKQADKLLRTSEERYRNLVENMDDIVMEIDAAGNYCYISPNFQTLSGYSVTEEFGNSALKYIHPDDVPLVQEKLSQAPTGQRQSLTYRVLAKKGDWRWLETSGQGYWADDGTLHIISVARDVTERRQTEDKLRESERQMQALITSLDDIVFEFDADGTYLNTWASDESLLAQPKASLTGRRIADVLGEENSIPYLKAIKQVITSGVPTTLEYSLNLSDKKHWFLARINPVLVADATKPTVSMVVRDISASKQAEEKLQASERTLKLFAEYAPAAIAMFDRDMCYIAASRRFITDYRLGDVNVIGRSHYEVFPEISERWKAIHQRCLAGAIEKKEEDPFPRIDGSLDWVKWEIRPWYEQNGEIGGIILFSEVITERKEAQLALKANEERLRLILETTSDGFWMVDTQARFLDVNQAYCAMSGYTREELLQLSIMDVEANETSQDTEERIARIMRDGRDQFESRHRRKDGTVFDVDVTVNLLVQEQSLMICFCRDITVRKQAEALRRKNAALLSEAQRLGHIGHWEWNAPGHDLICSTELLRILELPPTSHVISQAFFNSMLVTDDRQRLYELDKTAFATHSDLDYEFCIQLGDGQLRWLHQHAQVFYGDGGRPYRMLGIIQDITERKQAEEALRESEEKYRVLMESLDSVVSTVDDEGRFLYMNDVAARQLQGTPEQFIGKTMHELFPPEVAAFQLGHIREVIGDGQKMVSEAQSVVQGERRWYKTTIQPIHNAQKQVAYALIHSIDIDDLKKAQKALEELNHTLEERVEERTAQVQDLYDNAPNGYYSLDARGRILMINQTLLNWLGYSRDELIGRPASVLLTGPAQELFVANFVAFKEMGFATEIELEILRKDGTLLPVLLDATAVYDANGQFLHSRATALDMTERRKADRALRESRDELRTANVALAKAARLKDEFLANMSHELRTPLNSILNFSESLLEQITGPLNERQQQWIRNIETSGQHLLSLINDILDLSKVEAGQMTLHLETVSVAQICQASLLFVKEIATKKQLVLTYHSNDQLAEVQADARRLKQILVNLLSNAVKFTPQGGRVRLEVTVDASAGAVHYAVEDTGIGIAAADLEHLFQPFTQLDSSLSRQHEGTGLGLALVSQLVALHGGTISVHSEPGRGSRFTVTLPLQPAGHSPIAVAATTTPLDQPPSRQVAQETRILLAEDSELNILAFTDYLQAKGYEVTVAHNGYEALDLAAETHPHLILMDIQMPDMDGLETIRQLRARAEFRRTPIIALTALAMPGDRERCLAAGADAYLTKPIGLKKLRELIQTLLTQ